MSSGFYWQSSTNLAGENISHGQRALGHFELRPEIFFGNNENTSIHGYEHVINSQITFWRVSA
jgi:hypothetical protein